MKSDIRERLPEYVLDLLPADEMRDLSASIAGDAVLRAEVDELRAALTLMAERLVPMNPSPEVRARVMHSVAAPAARFAPFLAQMAQIVQLSVDKMRAVVARIEEASFWEAGLPGLELAHFDAGPSLAGADAGFIRFAPGAVFPRHRHIVSSEITFVLEGVLRDGDGIYGPGSVVEHPRDFVHMIAAAPEQPLLIMVLHHGIQPVFGE